MEEALYTSPFNQQQQQQQLQQQQQQQQQQQLQRQQQQQQQSNNNNEFVSRRQVGADKDKLEQTNKTSSFLCSGFSKIAPWRCEKFGIQKHESIRSGGSGHVGNNRIEKAEIYG
ncbi:hypothetical protein HELRODRAFT_163301 [Helobdella robusta]|uniref:Uncharacterized protein n=1 Tax=Helobdella robusta TaxID=6412 RepID=T1ETV8_HELRO|nr:hypothetical protein HELRODRAFT_163301 [Helobdella robusta]ESN96256.1 hypothetical protein HELRODRAFT_163301 [Helobdella robusta]